MPHNYNRTSNRKSWEVENRPKNDFRSCKWESGYKMAANHFGVPQSTLKDLIKIYHRSGNIETATQKGLGYYICPKCIEDVKSGTISGFTLILRHNQKLLAYKTWIFYMMYHYYRRSVICFFKAGINY